jgi:RNA polymerase sigma-70 factor, ECF subfamily
MIAVLDSISEFAPPVAVAERERVPIKAHQNSFDAAECVQQVRRGCEDAARALMERLYPLIIKLVRAHRPRRTSEQDLIQTVYMKIFSRLDQYSGLVPIEHWVSRITINTCLNQLDAERIRPEWRWSDFSEEEQRVLECAATVEEPDLHGSMAAEVVNHLLEVLPPADRLVIQLLHLEEKSINEIARITGWSAAMVKVRAFRARNKLKKHLRKLEPAMRTAGTSAWKA